jgi:predicted GH43/DUF377 family glycosyl hydrolase
MQPFQRYKDNPILTRADIPYPCNTVFNAAACAHGGQYLLLLRIEDLRGRSHLTLARSSDGYSFVVDAKPWITPSNDPKYEPYERFGVEDPRITALDGAYYITYTAYGPHGTRVGIGRTQDFKAFERFCLATEVDNKDAVLFPEKIDDRYVLLTRPGSAIAQQGSVWIAFSSDLIYWGESRVLHSPQPGWGAAKIGASTPPIATDKGWLVLYHGVRATGAGVLYRIGALLLERQDPTKVLGYTPHFIFGPETEYERIGDVPNVVFPCGLVEEPGKRIRMYYGCADTCIAVAEASIEEIVRLCTEAV